MPLASRSEIGDFVFTQGTAARRLPLLIVAVNQGDEPKVYVYNIETRERICEMLGHTNRVVDLAVSEDGRFLASAADDATVRVWDSLSAQERMKRTPADAPR